jgi:peptidyl-prolyl cis-trans isomerase C
LKFFIFTKGFNVLKTNKFKVLAILTALAINPAFAEDKSAAVVNGKIIPQERVEMNVKAALEQGQTDTPELRKVIRDDLINREVIAQEALKGGLDKSADVQQQVEQAKQNALINAFIQENLKKNPITDEQLKQAYDTLKAKLGDKEYNARHILVETEAEAKAIIAQLDKKDKKAASFDKLAEKSKDTASATHGGSLGWTVPSNMVEPFANALLTLKKGETTKDPVHSQFGWHVIKLDDVRPLQVPAFDQLKPQLQQRLQQQNIQKTVAELRAASKVE